MTLTPSSYKHSHGQTQASPPPDFPLVDLRCLLVLLVPPIGSGRGALFASRRNPIIIGTFAR